MSSLSFAFYCPHDSPDAVVLANELSALGHPVHLWSENAKATPGVQRMEARRWGEQALQFEYDVLVACDDVLPFSTAPQRAAVNVLWSTSAPNEPAEAILQRLWPIDRLAVPSEAVASDYRRCVAIASPTALDSVLWVAKLGEGAAKVWSEQLTAFVDQRFARHRKAVCDRLIYASDLVIAHEVGGRYPTELAAQRALSHKLLNVAEGTPERYFRPGNVEGVSAGWKIDLRMKAVAERIPKGAQTLLDVGCGAGGLLANAAVRNPDLRVMGVDTSAQLIASARAFLPTVCPRPENVAVRNARIQELTGPEFDGAFDVVLCTEVLEHIVDTQAMVHELERVCRPGGTILLTVPAGPWEALGFHEPQKAELREHVHHFQRPDLEQVFGKKRELHIHYHGDRVARGEPIGNWIVSWQNDPERPTGSVDIVAKVRRTRPLATLSACLIVKNEEDHLLKCVKSLLPHVDQIVVYDTGSTDHTAEMVEWMQRDRYQPEIVLVRGQWGEGRYAEARNASIAAATGDWILWCDADDVLVGGPELRKYLNSSFMPAYAIFQHHLFVDGDAPVDAPVRLFRRDCGTRFFGLVDEVPEFALNQPVAPIFTLPDVSFAHVGYLTRERYAQKRVQWNTALILEDRIKNPDRLMGLVSLQRLYLDVVDRQTSLQGALSDEAVRFLQKVIQIHQQAFRAHEGRPVLHRYFQASAAHHLRAQDLLERAGLRPE